MVSTLQARPNHYDALGLDPAASDDEIARGFARQMGLFRPMAESAQIGIAFETLRDPAKRRAYDAALGLRPEPPRPAAPTAVAFKILARIDERGPRPVQRRPAEEQPRNILMDPPAQPDGAIADRPGAFIAAALRPPTAPEPLPPGPPLAQPPERRLRPQADVTPIARADSSDRSVIERMRLGALAEDEDRPIRLSPTGAIVGGIVLAVALFGAWAGTQVGNSATPPPATPAARIALPPAARLPERIASNPAPKPSSGQFRSERYASLRFAPPRTGRDPASRETRTDQPPPVAIRSVGLGQSDSMDAESLAEQPVAEAPRVAAAAASMPLPNAVIARTIERIGYACGKIGSTAPVAGAPGVFNVACTSGQSYQATPVHGRYRFRRVKG